ncbi:MAG: PaaI family thioesterase [Chloroflexota bacterium]
MVSGVDGEVTIERRFRGPVESGNGGYACGVLARFLDAEAVEVTLRRPPPLDRALAVEAGDGRATMHDGDALVAEAEVRGDLELELPRPVGVEEATAAWRRSPLRSDHPFPECFVCGPARCGNDGFCVTCGPLDGGDAVAAPWRVEGSLPLEGGSVAPKLVWSVLDCPGGIAAMLVPDAGVAVLGRLTASIDGAIEPGATCVAMGWPIDREGRKLHAGSAIFSEDGEPLARARATWIELRD